MVDYQNMMRDRNSLKKYLEYLSLHRPDHLNNGRDSQLAYWINAYNAFTVDLILENYPVSSINDIGPWIQIPLINSVFDQKHIVIGGEKMSLNDIEHGIIRKEFEEPGSILQLSVPPDLVLLYGKKPIMKISWRINYMIRLIDLSMMIIRTS